MALWHLFSNRLAVSVDFNFGHLARSLHVGPVGHDRIPFRDGLNQHNSPFARLLYDRAFHGWRKRGEWYLFLDLHYVAGRVDQSVPIAAVDL